jgi:anti-sigma B factor antagonist
MTFSVVQGDPVVVVVDGDVLGGAEALDFTRAITDLVRDGARNVVVDLAGVNLMNSSGLGMLVAASGTIRTAGGTMSIAAAGEKIQGLFKMTRLDSVLVHYPTRDQAIAARR